VIRPAAPDARECHGCGLIGPCRTEGCPVAAALTHPGGPRRYRLGPALVAAVAVGALMVFVSIIALAAISGIRLAESTENRPTFISPSAYPCPRRGGPPPC
jgi:hypothetical protein